MAEMLQTLIPSGPSRPQDTARSQNSADPPLVVVIDPRRLIGQCTAAGLQDADSGMRYRSCRTIDEWRGEDHDRTALLLLSGTSVELDQEIASIAGCEAAPPFAIVSTDADPHTVSAYLNRGARGYIATSQHRAEVLDAVHLIAAGEVVVSVAPSAPRQHAGSQHA